MKLFCGKVDICGQRFLVKLWFVDVYGTDKFCIESMNAAFSYLSISIFIETCGNRCSLRASNLSQLSSSIPSFAPGLLQPHISSSKAQSPALEEATWGEAVYTGKGCVINSKTDCSGGKSWYSGPFVYVIVSVLKQWHKKSMT